MLSRKAIWVNVEVFVNDDPAVTTLAVAESAARYLLTVEAIAITATVVASSLLEGFEFVERARPVLMEQAG
jgi:hypothetical protein